MSLKKVFIILMGIFIITALSHHASAQMKKIKKFKNVNIPFNLKCDDIIIEKGQYDLEIWAYRAVRQWSLKIIKKGETLCIVSGKILRDECPGARGQESEEIPEDPTLKMSRIPALQIFNIIFETGKLTQYYTCYRVRFQLEYESQSD